MRPGHGLTFDGQSFNYAPADGRGVAALVQDELGPHAASVVGVSGTTYATRVADAPQRSWWSFHNSAEPVLVDIGGQSDLLAGLSAAQILTAMEGYHDAARAAGAHLTATCTVPPMTAAWGYTAPMEAARVALNPLILASDHFDVVADIAALPHAADPADTAYFSDGLHPTAALAAEFTSTIAAALRSVGVT